MESSDLSGLAELECTSSHRDCAV